MDATIAKASWEIMNRDSGARSEGSFCFLCVEGQGSREHHGMRRFIKQNFKEISEDSVIMRMLRIIQRKELIL